MLGMPAEGGRTLRDTLREIQTTFNAPAPASPAAPIAAPNPSVIPGDYISGEGADDCHEYMLPQWIENPASPNVSTAAGVPALTPFAAQPAPRPGLTLRFDAPAIVQGVIFSEILTRPAQRRRPGTWPAR
jgi:hypothetical protein